jgi:type I protein arginine methyltransferase
MFWSQPSFHGVDLRSLGQRALEEAFSQPVVDTWHPGVLVSDTIKWSFDFERDAVERLHKIDVPFELSVTRTCILHGLASWFDVCFDGSM